MRLVFPLTALWLVFLVSCTYAPHPLPPVEPPAPVEQREATPPNGAGEVAWLIAKKFSEQVSSPSTIFRAPAGEFSDFVLRVELAQPVVDLSVGVIRFVGGQEGLAIINEDGTIQVLGQGACRSLVLPQGETPEEIAWRPGSPRLAVLTSQRRRIRVFELNNCAEIATLSLRSSVRRVAISPHGTWLAAIDEVHGLWSGPAIGPLSELVDLRFPSLGVFFSPAEGLLLVVDEAGWLVSWATASGLQVASVRIPGGPFVSSSLQGNSLILQGKTEWVNWDLSSGKVVQQDRHEPDFFLEKGILRYRSPDTSAVKRLVLGKGKIVVEASSAAELVRVHDMDGALRYYSAITGEPAGVIAANDWIEIPYGEDYRLSKGSIDFVLADPVYQEGGWRLYSRSVPGGFLLWWEQAEETLPPGRQRGMLPVRMGLKGGPPGEWVDILAEPRPTLRPETKSME